MSWWGFVLFIVVLAAALPIFYYWLDLCRRILVRFCSSICTRIAVCAGMLLGFILITLLILSLPIGIAALINNLAAIIIHGFAIDWHATGAVMTGLIAVPALLLAFLGTRRGDYILGFIAKTLYETIDEAPGDAGSEPPPTGQQPVGEGNP